MPRCSRRGWTRSSPRARQPGSRWEYCSPGFWVLAELVTRLSGSHYTDNLRSAVTDPLGMHNTRYEPLEAAPERWAGADALHEAHLAEQVRRAAYPAGGVVGTAADLVTLGRALLAGGTGNGYRLVAPATVAACARKTVDGWYQGRAVTWGLGWELGGPGDFRSERTLFQSTSTRAWW